jgi:3-oxoacyl-[acyl-carrier-protein] synthase II
MSFGNGNGRHGRRRVVITGLGVVAPNGIGKDEFWKNLIAGKSAVDYIQAFDASEYPCKVAAEVRDFRASEFLESRKVKQMGRFSQFAIAATRLALEDAHLSVAPALSPEVAVCYGSSGGGDVFEDAARNLFREGVRGVASWSALEYPPHAPSSYVSTEFKLTGPSLSATSNCCTGLDSIHLGYLFITSGKARVAVVGSSEAPISPVAFATFCSLGSLTTRSCPPSEASRPYDFLRDGLVIAEGAATLILEDLEFALARGAEIYAEILGYSSASEALGMRRGDLTGKVMGDILSGAIAKAGLTPSDIDHINAHGSSLPDFDICDSNAFKLALGPIAYKVPISSIKSMIGQPFSAAGALQTAAACMSIQQNHVPPTINQEVPDPNCDLDYVPNVSRTARVRNVLINGHSFGGSVAALVVGRYID